MVEAKVGVDHNGGSVLGGKIVLLQIGLEIELGGRLVLELKGIFVVPLRL